MPRRKTSEGKAYPTYQPYPVAWDRHGSRYGTHDSDSPGITSHQPDDTDPLVDFADLAGDTEPTDWFPARSPPSNDANGFRPLRLLQSLFADRLDLLRAALDELGAAGDQRETLAKAALEDIDSRIEDCDKALSFYLGSRALNDFERRKHLERQLSELKRQRRQEAVMSWRDLLALKREIRALKRDIDSLNGTVRASRNRRPPT